MTDYAKWDDTWQTLTPSEAAVRRMQGVAMNAYEQRSRSILLEWWNLVRARPLKNTGLVAVCLALLVMSPASVFSGLWSLLSSLQLPTATATLARALPEAPLDPTLRKVEIFQGLCRGATSVHWRR